MFEQWCSFCNERGIPVLKICVSSLVEYLDHLQVTHDYAYTTLSMHVSVMCSILQPTEQIRASTAPLVNQLFKGEFRKKPPARVWADTWDVKKVLDLLHAWGEPSVLNYRHLNTEDRHDLGPSHSQKAIRSEPAENCSGGYADIRGLSYLPASLWGYKCQAKLPTQSSHNTEVGRRWLPMPSEAYKRIHSQNQRQRTNVTSSL